MNITDSITSDLWSLHLGIIGIFVSVMTLLYASLSSKVEELKILRVSEDFSIMNRATAVENSVKSLRKLNKLVAKILVCSFALFVVSTTLKYCRIHWIVIGDVAATLILLFFCIYVAYKIYYQYQNETL